MKRCPECGTDYPDGAGYCPQDGVLLVEDVAGEKREGWRMIMPTLVRTQAAEATDGAAEEQVAEEQVASAEGAADSPPAKTPVGDDRGARGGGSRRRRGRQMILGAFAPVPRPARGAESKKTILAYSAPQARPGDSPAAPAAPAAVAASGPTETGGGEGLVGRVLDLRYRIDGKIGEGGMGLVYRATHVIIDKPLAIKVLRSEFAAQNEVVQRFLQEAQLASKIKHPNVVEVSDYGQTGVGDAAYYVMECLSGRTLAQAIAAEGRLAPGRAVEIAIQIARGLGAAHAQGIVHRDLKPDNVFLCTGPEGQEMAKILDFGIARSVDRTSRLTGQGVLVGTPAYMAPEQAKSSNVDARADLYSLGVILFECLAGKAPFVDRGPMETINQHLFTPPPGLRAICPELLPTPTVERVIRHLLAKDRGDRPGDAAKLISLLEDARREDLGDLGGAPTSASRRVDTAALGSGPVVKRAAPEATDVAAVDDSAPTRVRGERVAVTDGIKIRGREDADVIQSRTVSPSGRIQKRPSVIIKRGTPIERFVPPPPPAPEPPTSRSELSNDELVAPERGRRGPPLPLIIGVAAVVAMALTVSVWKYWLKSPKATPAQTIGKKTSEDYVRLRFESSPSGAEVLLSGERVIGRTPIDFQAPRGDEGIVFVFRLPGHVDVAKTVLPDQTKPVRADLNPAPVDGAGEAELSAPGAAVDPAATGGSVGAVGAEPAAVAEPGADPGTKPRPKPPRTKTPSGKQGGAKSGGSGAAVTPVDEPPVDEPPPPTDPRPQPTQPKEPKPASDLGELKNPFAR